MNIIRLLSNQCISLATSASSSLLHLKHFIMLRVLVLIVGFISFSTAQDCPLPTIDQIEAALPPLLVIADGPQSYSPNVTEGSVQYVCQAQGSMINNYTELSLIATFTPNPGQPEQTKIMSLECTSDGTWSGVTNDGLPAPPASVVGVPPRTDCYRCRASFATDRCRGKPIVLKILIIIVHLI